MFDPIQVIIMQFDDVIDEGISCWKDAPIAYGLDIGVTRDGRTLSC